MRLTGAFVSRFLEEWQHAQDMEGERTSWGQEARVVERFLEAIKYELTAVLVPEVIPNSSFSVDARNINFHP